MNKGFLMTLALIFLLGIAGTASAAANPFADVPAKHWAYDAVSKLAQAGILDGYGDGTYRGGRIATRYELAQATAKAMARADKANAEMKQVIDRLSIEFADELNNIGVRVSQLEQNASTIKFSGDMRLRVQTNFNLSTAKSNAQTVGQGRIGLNASAPLNDKLDFQGRATFETNVFDPSSVDVLNMTASLRDRPIRWDIGQFNYKFDRANKLAVGRMAPSVANGFVSGVDGDVLAAAYAYEGSRFKASFGVGDWNDMSAMGIGTDAYSVIVAVAKYFETFKNRTAYWADLSYQPARNLKLFGSAFIAAETQQYPFNVLSLGLQGQLGPNWQVKANYAWNTAQSAKDINAVIANGDAPTAWAAQLQYKGAKRNDAGSWGMALSYRDLKPMAMDYGLAGGILVNDIGMGEGLSVAAFKHNIFGVKGWGIQADYTLFRDFVLAGTFLMYERNNSMFRSRGDEMKVVPAMYVQANLYF